MPDTANDQTIPTAEDGTQPLQDRQGGADVSADDEKKKYIAQYGDPNAQRRAQDVPEPASNEAKDLQNEKALEEHQAAGEPVPDDAKQKELDGTGYQLGYQQTTEDKSEIDQERDNEKKYNQSAQDHADKVSQAERDKLKDKS